MGINFRGFRGIKQGSCTKIAIKEGVKQPEGSTINACSSIATLYCPIFGFKPAPPLFRLPTSVPPLFFKMQFYEKCLDWISFIYVIISFISMILKVEM